MDDITSDSKSPVTVELTTKKTLPPGFLDFNGLLMNVPLGGRTLREEIKKGHIPAIRLPGGRRLLFHMPSVEKALLRYQRGGIG